MIKRWILEGEEVSSFVWRGAREMRKCAEETRFDGGYRDGSERGGEARLFVGTGTGWKDEEVGGERGVGSG
jgi:hypothetical protein